MPGLNIAQPKSPNILRDNIDLIILLLNKWDMGDYINSYNCCLDNLDNQPEMCYIIVLKI